MVTGVQTCALPIYYVEQQNELNSVKYMMQDLKNITTANKTYENIAITFEAPIFKLVDYILLLLIIVLISFFIKGFA